MAGMDDAGGIASSLERLNPEQQKAVRHTGKPLLILAGAGSGKTRVITTKIAWLIGECGADPRSILAVTFTNKAAREMAERARRIDERASGAMLRTFHSFGAWFLRRNGNLAGLDSGFVIYDDDDVVSLLGSVMEDAARADVRGAAFKISRAKDLFLSPSDAELDLVDSSKQFRRVYTLYEERLAKTGNVDFGDLIKKPVEILRNHPETASRFRERFRVIMVDEYQDANSAQFELLRELYSPENYLCVVGDDDQSIYRFRGAEVRNILEFPDRFSGTEIIRLERNYRSTGQILRTASSVVDHNKGRLGKTLRAERGGGKLPVLAFLPNQDEEAAYCASLVSNSVKAGNSWADWAVLYRTNAQSLSFETEFLRRGIPYRVVGSLKFYEREEIKDVLALLSFLANPRDEVAFRRMINKPARGVGPVTVDRIVDAAGDNTGAYSLAAAARNIDSVSARARAGIETFLAVIEEGRSLLETTGDEEAEKGAGGGKVQPMQVQSKKDLSRKGQSTQGQSKQSKKEQSKRKTSLRAGEGLSALVVMLAENSGIAAYHEEHDEIAGNLRVFNLQELANAASLYKPTAEGLLEFLEHIELDRSIEDSSQNSSDAVTLITFHNTKGLEFRRVIMTGLEQGIFPRTDKTGEDLEEERRLFYVGATRAMDELYLTSCAVRRVFGRTAPSEPSLFLQEVDREGLRVIGGVPYGFTGPKKAGSPPDRPDAFSPRGGKSSSDGRWRTGDRVFHDDHGYGAVIAIQEEEDGPVIRVRFDTGAETRFLSRFQSRQYTKIGRDS
ncbi:MAG: ATP-dependent helicase [Treponema sp.]|jgi:DNA helicase-2/ATP-dependent DNA helicase PcrA|nr:ATP-dependent helicase [Treponema sp.]